MYKLFRTIATTAGPVQSQCFSPSRSQVFSRSLSSLLAISHDVIQTGPWASAAAKCIQRMRCKLRPGSSMHNSPAFNSLSAAACFSTSSNVLELNRPLTGNDMTRAGGIASMFRIPIQKTTDGLDVCFVGIPLDIGVSNRTGTRFGPRQIRMESPMIRLCNPDTGAAPFESLQVADVGDVNINVYNLQKSCVMICEYYKTLIANGCIPLTMGGDHTLTYPVLQAIADKYGPVGLVHVDAHNDTQDTMLGEKIAHGTPFRRAVDENLINPKKTIQIGLRGPSNDVYEHQWALEQGFRVVTGKDCWYKSLEPLMMEVREMMGDGPVYLTFDIDALDPSIAPGTGTPEIAGLNVMQALEIIRGLQGLNLVGCDLVEVSPPYDPLGTTALLAANLMFEMLCILPRVKYYEV
ncbi:agmatinase, mitochondrial-like [Anneissia japonica]|uniref:agmatinase, mitochondrial-like n=1 Tax=Anneissia japonica TaxID=1529436 RepID=UPI001425ABC9|nr:agmatinase, mitochondrial-like [Anneissia japonica]